jgi:hypothetical protein
MDCIICGHERPDSDLMWEWVPSLEDVIWRCRDFVVCASIMHACAQGLHAGSCDLPQHVHLTRQLYGGRRSPRGVEPTDLFHARMREHRAALGIEEVE